jgi:O-antigen/teichoic acid export membrane protein
MLPVRLFKCMSLNKSIKFKINWHPTIFKEVLKYSLGVFLLGIFQFSATNLRPIIVGIQSDILNVADYRIMQQITSLILIFTGSFMGILLPIISKLDPLKDIQITKNIVTEYTKIISLLLTSLVFGFILISKPFIILYLGEEYLEIRIWLIIWSLSVLGTHNTAISALILAQKSLKPITYFTMFSSVISLLACWFITPYYGVGGAVISLVIYIFLQLLFYYSYYIPKVMKFDSKQIFIYSFSIPVLIGILSAIIVQFLSLSIKFDNFTLEIIGKSLSFLIIFLVATNFLSIKLSKIKSTLNFKI